MLIVFSACLYSTGGRSRSPALLMAFLMTDFQLSFSQSLEKLSLMRNVIAINDGFQYQLRCLEAAKLNTMRANQVMLQHQLEATKRSSCIKEFKGKASTARGPHFLDQSGRIDGKVPTHFELCIPQLESAKHSTLIIPALRSMATLFTCRGCHTPLVSSSSVVNTASEELRTAMKNSQKVPNPVKEKHVFRTLDTDRGLRVSGFVNDSNVHSKVQLHKSASQNLHPFSPFISEKVISTPHILKTKQIASQSITKRLQLVWERCKPKAEKSQPDPNLRLSLAKNQRVWQEQMSLFSDTGNQYTQCSGTMAELSAAESMLMNATFRDGKPFSAECDGSIQIAPLPWLLCQVDSTSSGKLNCPSCHEAIGRWKWKEDKQNQPIDTKKLPRFILFNSKLSCLDIDKVEHSTRDFGSTESILTPPKYVSCPT